MNCSKFETEVIPHLDALYGLALKYTHNEADAQDLVQDTLFKALNSFASFDAGSNCRAWLFKILTNTFINKYRRHNREKLYADSVIDEYKHSSKEIKNVEQTDCFGMLTEHDFLFLFPDEIVNAFKNISKEFSSIIILADIEELSYREIASRLNIPLGTVMSRLSRARQSMRSFLGDYAHSLGYA